MRAHEDGFRLIDFQRVGSVSASKASYDILPGSKDGDTSCGNDKTLQAWTYVTKEIYFAS